MNMTKIKRLLKALSNESVKRLPYVFFVLIVLSLVQFVRLSNQTAQGVQIAKNNSLDGQALLKKVATLSEDNKQLITQNKELTEQNIQIANDNSQHLDCLADLFARYTRNAQPIYQIDLENCKITTVPATKSSAKPAQSSPRSSSPSSGAQSQSASSSSPKSTPSSTTTQPVISQTPPVTPKPNLLHRVLNFLGL